MIFNPKMRVEKNIVKGNKIMLPNSFFYSFIGNCLLLFVIFSLSVTIVLMRENFLSKQLGNFEERFYQITDDIGFKIEDVTIKGRKYTSKDEVIEAMQAYKGDNIIRYDLWNAKRRLEELPWVKEASVRRSFFPNIIYASVKEKKAIAVWQINDDFYPIDEDGKIINTMFIPQGIELLIVGKGAPEHINELLKILKTDEDVFQRVKAAQYISERRWNIILDNIESGITIKLPEENFPQAWNKLIKLNTTEGILKRKLTFIDLRLPDKVVVKLLKGEDTSSVKNKKEHKI